MKLEFRNHVGDFISHINIGTPYKSNHKHELHVGDVVEMIGGKVGVVLEERIFTRKEVGDIHHVNKIIKKYDQLKENEVYLKGLITVKGDFQHE